MVWLEYFGVITGLLYLFLEIKQHKAMWVVGFLTSLVYVFVFLFAKIYADMGLQTYYVGISVYGFYQWTRKKHETHTENDSLPSDRILYTHLSLPLFVGIIGTLAVVFAILWYLLHQFTDSPIPVGGCVHHVGRHCRYLDAGKANYRALDFLGNRKPRFRISLLPSGLVSDDATLFLLCDTSHSRLLQLAEERGRVLNYEF